MNKATRKELREIADGLRLLTERVEEIAGDERDKFENLPEGLQEGERGEALEEAADALEEVFGDMETALDALEAIPDDH